MAKSTAVILLIVLAAGSAAAAKPRQPTGRWVVEFDDAQCIASRNYGSAEEPLLLLVKAPPLGNVIQIGVLRPGRPDAMAEQLDGHVSFDQRLPIRTSMLTFTPKQQKRRVYLTNLTIDQFAPAKSAKVISVRATGALNEKFGITGIGQLMKVMDDCVADLRNVWNVTYPGGSGSKLKEQASGNLQGLIKVDDYPGVAIDKGQSGTVTLALLVNENGRVADCTVIGTSGAASLDAQSCITIKERARFKPAIGLDGRPAKGSFTQRITWRVE